MKTSQKTLIDLYLAFVRTWILEYQLSSIHHSTCPLAESSTTDAIPLATTSGPEEADRRKETPSVAPLETPVVPVGHTAATTSVRPTTPLQRVPMEPSPERWQASRKSNREERVRPSVAKRRSIPALHPTEMGRASATAVAGHTRSKVRHLTMPHVVKMILEDCKEHWQHLTEALESRMEANGLRTIFVTGGRSGEGYTTVSIALAFSLAEHTTARVLLMDADFTHPMVARQLSIKPNAGLEQVVLDNMPLDEAILECQEPRLSILPMVFGFEFPAMAAGSRRFTRIMEELHSQFDLIVMDGGCRFRDGAPLPILPGIDAALIVRNPGKTSEKILDRIDEQLLAHGISSLGVIENEP